MNFLFTFSGIVPVSLKLDSSLSIVCLRTVLEKLLQFAREIKVSELTWVGPVVGTVFIWD